MTKDIYCFFIFIIWTILFSCSKTDNCLESVNSNLDILIQKSGSELVLVFPVETIRKERPYLFRMQCYHSKKNPPNVYFEYIKENGERTILYKAPILNSSDTVDFVLPPLINGFKSIQARLSIRESSIRFGFLSFEECPPRSISDSSIVFHAHLGYLPFAPENTLPSFDYCGKSLFKACIATPIESADGVIFCYHEDNPCLSPDEGKTIIGLSAKEFHRLSSDVILSKYDAGIYKGWEWKNTTVCTIDDFLAICSKYNMAPTFSTHPMLSDAGWEYIRKKLDELSLTSKCTFKAFDLNILGKAYSVFGSSIYQYIYDAPICPIEDSLNSLSQLGLMDVSLGIEFPLDHWNEAMVKTVTSKGIIASAYSIGSDGNDIRSLVSWGVTEFTSDSFIMYSNWMSLI